MHLKALSFPLLLGTQKRHEQAAAQSMLKSWLWAFFSQTLLVAYRSWSVIDVCCLVPGLALAYCPLIPFIACSRRAKELMMGSRCLFTNWRCLTADIRLRLNNSMCQTLIGKVDVQTLELGSCALGHKNARLSTVSWLNCMFWFDSASLCRK